MMCIYLYICTCVICKLRTMYKIYATYNVYDVYTANMYCIYSLHNYGNCAHIYIYTHIRIRPICTYVRLDNTPHDGLSIDHGTTGIQFIY